MSAAPPDRLPEAGEPENAAAYLKRLQANAVGRLILPPKIRDQRLRQGLRDIVETTPQTIAGQQDLLTQVVVRPLVTALPSHVHDVLGDVTVGVLPTYDPNAWALRAPAGDQLVVIHSEMLAMLSYHNELRLAFARLDESDHTSAVRLLRNGYQVLFDAFSTGRSYDGPPIAVDLSRDDFVHVSLQTGAHQAFIVAHEFAHVALGHTAIAQRRMHVLAGGVNELNVERFEWSRKQEHDADARAMEWLCNLDVNSQEPLIRFLRYAPALAAEVFLPLHVILAGLGRKEGSASHPLPLERGKARGCPWPTGCLLRIVVPGQNEDSSNQRRSSS